MLRDLLPLQSLAKHACVASSWRVAYKSRLLLEQQQLRALATSPSSPYTLALQDFLVHIKAALPVFESPAGLGAYPHTIMVHGAWREKPTEAGLTRYDTPFSRVTGDVHYRGGGVETHIYWDTPHHYTLALKMKIRFA